MRTSGQRKLKKWMAGPPRRSQAQVAAALGITQQSLSQWVCGQARPSAHMRGALEAVSNGAVRADDWLTTKERTTLLGAKPLDTAVSASPRTEAA